MAPSMINSRKPKGQGNFFGGTGAQGDTQPTGEQGGTQAIGE